jgi:predicted acetyltransferase
MIEVRQVREEELDDMLVCMTTAFGVAREAWADGFYNGPYNDIKWKRVVVADGKVVSCLVFIPAEIHLGGSTVSMGGIAGVATLPDERKHGYAGMLMENSVPALRGLGFATSGLYPFSYRYYRRFGWEFCSHWMKLYIKPELLPAYSDVRNVRPYEESDLPSLMRLYKEHFDHMVGPFVRDERHWNRHIISRPGEALVYDRGGVQGYLLGYRGEEDGEKRYWAHEMVASTQESRRGLVGYLAQRAGEVERISVPSCKHNLESLGLFTPRAHWEEGYSPRSTIEVTPGFMFRVIDLKDAMRALVQRIDHVDGDLTIRMEDQIGTWNNDPVTIRGEGAPEVVGGNSSNFLKADVRIFSRIYTGYMSPDDAYSQGLIEVSGPEALRIAEQLFPESEPFVPHLDEY